MDKKKDSDRSKAEDFIAQSLYGILPQDLYLDSVSNKKDPFESFSEEEKRLIKRKFRKLKRKLRVGKYYSAASMWVKINAFLKNNIPT
tara:strand:- start:140 stop:403 length:264 start_codon:yes stop_codon:yes gene_type:complete